MSTKGEYDFPRGTRGEEAYDTGDENPRASFSQTGGDDSEREDSDAREANARIHSSFPHPRDSNGKKVPHKDPHAQ